MSRIFNFITVAIVTVTNLVLVTVPVRAVDVDDGLNGSSKQNEINEVRSRLASEQAERLETLCERYTNSRLGKTTDDKRNKFNEKLSSKSDDLATKRTEWDEKRTEARELADTRRQEHYDKLLLKAGTDVQKQAVLEFKIAVEQAVTDRRTAQDAARDAFRQGVDAVITERKTLLESASSDLRFAVEAAIAKAKTSCQNGTPLETVQSNLKAELEAARSAFSSTKSENQKISEKIAALLEVRKEATELAKVTFEDSMDSAKTNLEMVLAS